MKTSVTLSEIASALCAAQAELEVAKKDSTNPFFSKSNTKAKYADINAVLQACLPALNKHGLILLQAPATTADRHLRMTTRLLHKSGEWIETELDLKPKEDSPQAFGSCITYARRYSIASLIALGAEDDDGNEANGNRFEDKKPQHRETPPQVAPATYETFSKDNPEQVGRMQSLIIKSFPDLDDTVRSYFLDLMHGKPINKSSVTDVMNRIQNELKASSDKR